MRSRTLAKWSALLVGLVVSSLATGCGPRLPPFTEVEGKTAYSLVRQGDATIETALPTRLI